MCLVSYSAGKGSVCLNGKLSVAEGNEEKGKEERDGGTACQRDTRLCDI